PSAFRAEGASPTRRRRRDTARACSCRSRPEATLFDAARQPRAQIAQLFFEIADALEQRDYQGQPVRVQLEVPAQAARAPRNDQPVRAEAPVSCVRVDRREHSVIHQFTQLGFGQPRQLAEFLEQKLMLLVQPHRLFGFHFAASCSKCPRGLKVEASASSLKSARSRSLVTVGTAIWTIAKRSPSPPCGLGRPRPASRSCPPACVPGGTLRRTDPPSVGTCTLVPSTASHGASGRSRKRSWPLTRNRRCGCSAILRYRSPSRPPFSPLPPLPGRRRRWPSVAPLGMRALKARRTRCAKPLSSYSGTVSSRSTSVPRWASSSAMCAVTS